MFASTPVGDPNIAYRTLREAYLKLRREYAELEVRYAKLQSTTAGAALPACVSCGGEMYATCLECD